MADGTGYGVASVAPVDTQWESTEHAPLTDTLGPDQAVPYHTEGSQEELFVPIAGPGAVRVAGETVTATPGTVVRVAPATPRSALTDGDARSRWVMFGAPPTGGPEEWDPGAVILE